MGGLAPRRLSGCCPLALVAAWLILLTFPPSIVQASGEGTPRSLSPARGTSVPGSRRIILTGEGPRILGINAGVSIPSAAARMVKWLGKMALGDREGVKQADARAAEQAAALGSLDGDDEENALALAWPVVKQELGELFQYTREIGSELGRKFAQALYVVTGARIAGIVAFFQWLRYLLLGYVPEHAHYGHAALASPQQVAAKRRPKPKGIPSWEEAAKLQEWIDHPEKRIADIHSTLADLGICKASGDSKSKSGGSAAGGHTHAHTNLGDAGSGPHHESGEGRQEALQQSNTSSSGHPNGAGRTSRRSRERRAVEGGAMTESKDVSSPDDDDFWGVSSLDPPKMANQKARSSARADVSRVSPKLRELENELTAWRKSSERLGEKTKGTREALSQMGGKLLEAIEYAGSSLVMHEHSDEEWVQELREAARAVTGSPPGKPRVGLSEDVATPQRTRFDGPAAAAAAQTKTRAFASPVKESRDVKGLQSVRSKVLEGAGSLASGSRARDGSSGAEEQGLQAAGDLQVRQVSVGIRAFSPRARSMSTDVASASSTPLKSFGSGLSRGTSDHPSKQAQGSPPARGNGAPGKGGAALEAGLTSPEKWLKGSPRAWRLGTPGRDVDSNAGSPRADPRPLVHTPQQQRARTESVDEVSSQRQRIRLSARRHAEAQLAAKEGSRERAVRTPGGLSDLGTDDLF